MKKEYHISLFLQQSTETWHLEFNTFQTENQVSLGSLKWRQNGQSRREFTSWVSSWKSYHALLILAVNYANQGTSIKSLRSEWINQSLRWHVRTCLAEERKMVRHLSRSSIAHTPPPKTDFTKPSWKVVIYSLLKTSPSMTELFTKAHRAKDCCNQDWTAELPCPQSLPIPQTLNKS